MTEFVFDSAAGMVGYYATLPAAGSRLVALLLRTAGLEADAVLRTKATVTSLVAGTTDEETSGVLTGYARQALTAVTSAPDTVNHRRNVDCGDIAFGALGGAANDVPAALVIAYDPTGSSADTALIPLTKHGITVNTPDGVTAVTFVVADFAHLG